MYVCVCMCVRFLGSSGGRAVNVELILVKGERRGLVVNFLGGLVLDRGR